MQYYPRFDDRTCLIIFPIIFNILFRVSFNKIVATLHLSSNLLFLKNVENGRVILLISNQGELGVYKCHKCVPIVLGFYLSLNMKFTLECIKKECPFLTPIKRTQMHFSWPLYMIALRYGLEICNFCSFPKMKGHLSTTPLYHKEIFCHLERDSIWGSINLGMLPAYVVYGVLFCKFQIT